MSFGGLGGLDGRALLLGHGHEVVRHDERQGHADEPGRTAFASVQRTAEDLAHHNCIVLSSIPSINRWPFRDGSDIKIVQVSSRVIVDDAEVAMRLAVAGAGIVRLSDLLVGEAVRRGLLVPLLVDQHVVEPLPVSAVYPQGRHRMAKVRAFVDFVVERFSSAPWRQWTARLPQSGP